MKIKTPTLRKPVLVKPLPKLEGDIVLTTGAKQKYKSMVLSHPNLTFDILDAEFTPDKPLPKSASLVKGDKITPILLYVPEGEYKGLLPASGKIVVKLPGARFGIFTGKFPYVLTDRWFYLTPIYIYGREDDTKNMGNSSNGKKMNNKQFINAIAEGEQGENPISWSPWQFGAKLELKPLERQLTKERENKIAETLKSTYMMMFWGLLISLVFLFILRA